MLQALVELRSHANVILLDTLQWSGLRSSAVDSAYCYWKIGFCELTLTFELPGDLFH